MNEYERRIFLIEIAITFREFVVKILIMILSWLSISFCICALLTFSFIMVFDEDIREVRNTTIGIQIITFLIIKGSCNDEKSS